MTQQNGQRPNVLLIMADQLRADSLGCAGHPQAATPNLDRLAAGGTRMARAYCTTPLCVPSRTTIFTGQRARRLDLFDNRIILDAAMDHLPGLLREQGYALALVGKNHAFTRDYLESWDFCEMYGIHGKEDHAAGTPPTPDERAVKAWRDTAIPFFEAPVHVPQPGPPQADPAIAQTGHALRFLQSRDQERPFFMYLSYEAPHFPYVLPEPYFSRYAPEAMPGPLDAEALDAGPARLRMQASGLRLDEMDAHDIRRVQASYLGMIAMVDEQIGRVLAALAASGELAKTVVLFLSDHGDFWGHRGLIGKTNALYEELLRIPMIWHGPGIRAGVVRRALVDTSDVLPTLLALLGPPLAPPAQVQGRAFAHLLTGARGAPQGAVEDAHRDAIVAESSLERPALSRAEIATAIAARDDLFAAEGPMWFVNRLGGETRSLYREASGLKLITHEVDGPELYDLTTDPHELVNLAPDPAYRARLDDMQRALEKT